VAVARSVAATLVRHSSAPRAIAVLGWVAAGLLVVGAAFPIEHDKHGILWTVRFISFLTFAAFVTATSLRPLARPSRRGRADV
jgi:hypothetical protein